MKERNSRDRSHGVGDHLEKPVDPPAEIARHPADDQLARTKLISDPDRADGQATSIHRVQRPPENVLAASIGPEQVYAALVDAE